MSKSAIEKALEKQNRESKKAAQQEALRQTVNTIISSQPFVGGMRVMDKDSEEILRNILSAYDENDMRRVRSQQVTIPEVYYQSLHFEFEKLKQYGMISSYMIWISAVWELTLTSQGISYFSDKDTAERKEREMSKTTVSIGSIVATGSSLILGDVIDSTISISSSLQRIENEIKEKGGEDAEMLRDIFDEVKELIENMQQSRHVPKNKKLFSKEPLI